MELNLLLQLLNGGFFSFNRLLNKAIITDFSHHTVKGGIVNLEYEKEIFYSENMSVLCQTKWALSLAMS